MMRMMVSKLQTWMIRIVRDQVLFLSQKHLVVTRGDFFWKNMLKRWCTAQSTPFGKNWGVAIL